MSKRKADFGTLEKENKRTNSFAHSWKTMSLRSFFFLSFFLSDNFFFLTSKNFQSVGQLSSSCFEVFAKTVGFYYKNLPYNFGTWSNQALLKLLNFQEMFERFDLSSTAAPQLCNGQIRSKFSLSL